MLVRPDARDDRFGGSTQVWDITGQQGDEQRTHPAQERYQSLARNRNGHNTYGIFSRDRRTHLALDTDAPVHGESLNS